MRRGGNGIGVGGGNGVGVGGASGNGGVVKCVEGVLGFCILSFVSMFCFSKTWIP